MNQCCKWKFLETKFRKGESNAKSSGRVPVRGPEMSSNWLDRYLENRVGQNRRITSALPLSYDCRSPILREGLAQYGFLGGLGARRTD